MRIQFPSNLAEAQEENYDSEAGIDYHQTLLYLVGLPKFGVAELYPRLALALGEQVMSDLRRDAFI